MGAHKDEAMGSEHVTDVTSAEFPQTVLQRSHEVPVVVDFWALWCGPCRVLGPLLERLAEEAAGGFELVKVDVDANQDLATQFAVQGIPTVIGFRDGVAVSRFSGALPEDSVRKWLAGVVPSELDLMVEQGRDAALAGDPVQAEASFRAVLARRADHPEAAPALAGMLIARGDTDEALIVLGKLPPIPEVERLQAAARLNASRDTDVVALERAVDAAPEDGAALLDLARALASHGEFEPALDHLLRVIRHKDEHLEAARTAMLDIFGVLGDEHPLTPTYRRQLSSALF